MEGIIAAPTVLLKCTESAKIRVCSAPSVKILVEKVRIPSQRWLKDRNGCILKAEDMKHYRKIVFALADTARIMGEIDKVGVM
jgi:hypothetical protein